jgi:cephalosporin hydroxylase
MSCFLEDSLNLPLGEVLNVIQKRIMTNTSYFGIKTLKNPMDFWAYREIIFEHKPDVIIEIGNNWGGSTLALAHIQDLMEHGRIIGVDIDHSKIVDKVSGHPRISLIECDAIEAFTQVKAMIKPDEKVLLIEDSAHTYQNTLEVLRLYSEFIHVDDYIIVEDTICHHGLNVGPSPGPYEAVETFVEENDNFQINREKESFLVTWNPKGFLKKVKSL